MKIGDIVMKKTAWEWLKYNPWMQLTDGLLDDRLGIIVDPCTKKDSQDSPVNCAVLWSDGKLNKNFRRKRLKVVE